LNRRPSDYDSAALTSWATPPAKTATYNGTVTRSTSATAHCERAGTARLSLASHWLGPAA